jgi:tetratricopeptide (TPR) repeat protein
VSTTGAASRLARAAQLLDLARPAEAKTAVVDVLTSEPDNPEALRVLVRCLIALHDGQSVATARRAVALDPENEQGHRLLAIALLRTGDSRAAASQARIAVSLAPFNWQTHYILTCALATNEPLEALRAGAEGLRVGPTEPSMHLAYGEAALACKLPDEAARSFEKVLALDPGNAAARNNLAILDLRRNRFGKAIDGFGSALTADPRLDLARRNIDVVALAMLLKLRYLMMLTEYVMARTIQDSTSAGVRRALAGGVLAAWTVLIGAGLSRIPKRFRKYVLGIPRRNRRAAIVAGVVAISYAGVVIGPLLNLVSSGVGLALGVLLSVTVLADLVWYSKWRKKLSSRRKARAAESPDLGG